MIEEETTEEETTEEETPEPVAPDTRTFEVTGPLAIAGYQPGDLFEATDAELPNADLLVEIGHLTEVD
ncbi:MAG: hypothetical protein HKN01_01575 [Acidimicrobiia bacterium]|nr:hypothetical protein [Acidimicrobiia bacterium]